MTRCSSPGTSRRATDYQWVIEQATGPTQKASAFAGRGWADLQLRRQFKRASPQWTQKLEAARNDFLTATGLDRNQVTALTGLGWSHYFISQDYPACGKAAADAVVSYVYNLKEAIRALDRVIVLEPTGAYHYRTRAQLQYLLRLCQPTYDQQKQIRLAIDDYTQALTYAPNQQQWWYTRGNLLFVVSDYAEAAASYRKAAELPPKAWNLWIALAKAELKRGSARFDAAAAAYDEAAKINPNNYREWWLLGWAAYEAGDYSLSIEVSGRAVSLQPKEPRTIFNRGLAYLAAGNTSAAQTDYQAGITAADRLPVADRATRYQDAIDDLRHVDAQQTDAARTFIKLLEIARYRYRLRQVLPM